MKTYIVSASEPIVPGSVPEWNHTVLMTALVTVRAEAKRFRKDYKVVTVYRVT